VLLYWRHQEMPLEVAMWKSFLAGATALAITGGALAYGQQDWGDFQRAGGRLPKTSRRLVKRVLPRSTPGSS
jgi:hypothetical protein